MCATGWPVWTRLATAAPIPQYTAATDKRIVAVLDRPVPPGYRRWTGPLIAAELGDVDVQYVWRFLRAQKIDLAARKSWCESNDPAFAAKAAEIVGFRSICPTARWCPGGGREAVDPGVGTGAGLPQTAQRARAHRPVPQLHAAWHHHPVRGARHSQWRGPRQTLQPPRRRLEFLDFINRIVAAHADTAIHVILDNLNTHKPRNDRWLRRHPNVHFHFTPTRASWLNQVEIWFSILQGQSLHGASFTSVKQLREHIDAFIKAYNTTAAPFAWTKSEVHQKRLKPRFAHQ